MSYQVLARKYRPRQFAELVGQEHVLRALENALDGDRLHHAFLFSGTRGVGKTTIARILAKALNCEQGISSRPCGQCSACTEVDQGRFVDLIEVDAASRTKVDDTRELMDNVQYAPARGRYKVYLVDEVHMLSGHSFNALLKTLEEPPSHVKFLLATTDPQKLPVTVLSRCLQFNLKSLPTSLIRDQLQRILEWEEIEAEPDGVALLASAADGSMRDGLSLLDQALAFGGGVLRENEVRSMLGTVERDHVLRLVGSLAEGDAAGLLETVADLEERTPDHLSVLDELTGVLQRLAVLQMVPEAGADWTDRDRLSEWASQVAPEDVQLWYQIGILGRRDLPYAPEPRAGLEMTLLRMLAFRPDPGDDGAPSGSGGSPRHRAAASTQAKPASGPEPQPSASAAGPTSPAPAAPESKTEQGTTKPEAAAEGPPGFGSQTSETATAEHSAASAPSVAINDWNAVVEALGLQGLSAQLAAHCSLGEWSDDTVRLRLDRRHENLRSERAVERLQQALGRFYGRELKLRIEVTDRPEPTPAKHAERKQEAEQERAREAIAADPNVQELEKTFGTRADMDSVRPGNPGETAESRSD